MEFKEEFIQENGLTEDQNKAINPVIDDYIAEEKKQWDGSKTSSKMIFLNKTCFNGLFRVNKKNKFNVPFGDYKNPNICPIDNLKKVSQILQKTKIVCGDFTKSNKYINEETFVYFDPPYKTLKDTASFVSYTRNGFFDNDQIKLAEFCKSINDKNAKFLLSNSDTGDDFYDIQYRGFTIDRVMAQRAINCKGNGRRKINELLIKNY